jgi:dolichol-phosphate mannosyltransferase
MREDATTLPAPAQPLHARLGSGLLRSTNWIQLLRFGVVGASGYVVNLVVFSAALHGFEADHRLAAAAAFVVAVANNFWWNRRWTFAATGGRASFQAVRFVVVSVASFLVALVVLEILVSAMGLPEVGAQAVSIVVATPMNFLGNRLWSFRS